MTNLRRTALLCCLALLVMAAASVLGLLLREFFGGDAIYGLVIGGVLMVLAGLATLLVDREAEPHT